ncbi:MAG TPA: peptidoglycan recognition family protein [Myxococcota bacterium]|nr:peptidoglycan recognition family protein [Myxococcota bacterium]HQK51515.1 peptidoglycan recognition family protein [Myxococcota bacterium]
MADIIIAGKAFPLPDSQVKVVTFRDPGGFSFYQGLGGQVAPLQATDESGDVVPLVRPRNRPAGAPPKVLGLQGAGWADLDPSGNALAALRKVVRGVVLHHDGTGSARICFETLKQRGLSSHFQIDRDGTVYQAADIADMTWHAAGLNAVTVGFDLNNTAVNLLSNPEATAPYGGLPSKDEVINGGTFRSWTYSDEQYRALIAVLRVLKNELGIQPVFPLDQDGGILRRVLVDPPPDQFSGIQCHWHSDVQKWDPGPGLDWQRILAGLRQEDATFPALPSVSSPSQVAKSEAERQWVRARVLQEGEPARVHLAKALETEDRGALFLRMIARACEMFGEGGYFPVGVNQTWHGGIHVPCAPGTPVRPMLQGELVAAHLVGSDAFPPGLGSNNFVVLRHRIPLPPRLASVTRAPCPETRDRDRSGETSGGEVAPPPPNELVVFSLYMHLDGVDWRRPTPLMQKILSRYPADPNPQDARPVLRSRLEAADPKKFPNPLVALRQGWVALFSPWNDPDRWLSVGPEDVLGEAGVFGGEESPPRVLHLEVFADDRYAEAMDLSLSGRYLVPGPQDVARDLTVRDVRLWRQLGWDPRERIPPGADDDLRPAPLTGKVLSARRIRAFFENADEEDRLSLRRLIVRHVSEWSVWVDWARTLLEQQPWSEGVLQESPGSEVRPWSRWFTGEASRWLQFTWLDDRVASHLGLRFAQGQEGVLNHFHPVNFLAWWLYLRSAVRGRPLEDILRCLQGSAGGIQQGVPAVVDDLSSMAGDGEWQTP